ncbi:MAG: methyltransferase domain-containing protein [Limnoraphis sp. WC205]|jgi:trans-aconitate methyltransferase|nr:methyltransferase domain-containing protein [Limnoraphis sp. WC205]
MSLETQFGQFADLYVATRPTYPEALFQEIVNCVPLPHDRALDLGAGTGLSTLPLCRWFKQVLAVEPDEGMAVKLRNLSPQIEVRPCSAQELNETPESIDLITMGNTLYWLDGSIVVKKALTWLRKEGILAAYRYGVPRPPEPIQAILETELRERWHSFRHPRLLDENYSYRVIADQSGFKSIQVLTVPYSIFWNTQQLIGYFCSTSYCSTYLKTLANPDRYVADLESQINDSVGSTPFPVDFSLELIIAQKG